MQASDPVLAIHRVALPQVCGYLLPRCGSAALAEDLTSETFLAAVSASRQGSLTEVSTARLVRMARHKLVGHWRRHKREQRSLAAAEASVAEVDDPWDVCLDGEAANAVLGAPGTHPGGQALPDGTLPTPGGGFVP